MRSKAAHLRAAALRAILPCLCGIGPLAAPAAGAAADTHAPPPPADGSAADSLGSRQHPDDIRFWPVPLDTVFVTARRLTRAQILARESAFATYLPVAGSRGPGEDAGDLLERAVGVQVRRYGGPGATATLSIRGADPGQVEVFLDRTPLRSASRSTIDLGALDAGQLEAIEVYRGAPPADLGGLASGAAVRLVTPAAAAADARLRFSAGSFGTRETGAQATGELGGGSRYLLSFGSFATRGDFEYIDDNGTPDEPGDDVPARWTNGDVRRLSLLGKFAFNLGPGRALEWSGVFSERAQGVPGATGRPTREVRLETSSFLQRIELEAARLPRPAPRLRGYAFRERRDHLFLDPRRELNLVGSPRRVEQAELRRGGGLHARWTAGDGRGLLGRHAPELLAEIGGESLRQAPPAGRPQEDRRERASRLLSIGDAWNAWRGAARLEAHYRWEETEDNYTGADPYRPFSTRAAHRSRLAGPRLGLRLARGGHSIKANYSRQGRFPTFAELFGYEGLVRGNAGLAPEEGRRADLGWRWEHDGGPGGPAWRIEQALYRSDLEQMIVFVMVSNRETKPFNLDRASIRGYEVDLALSRPPGLNALARRLGRRDPPEVELTLHATLQDARDEGVSPVYHGRQLTYHPPLQGLGGLAVGGRRWRLAYTARFRAGSYWSRSNLPEFKSAAQWSHDLQFNRSLAGPGLSLALRVENLTDATLEDVRGYPLPGRTWFAEIGWRLSEPGGAGQTEAALRDPQPEAP